MECESFVDYIYFITQKNTNKIMIDLDTGGFIIYMNVIKRVAK